MVDLKIPNLNKNSDNYLFKKKLSLRRKSKRKLIKESFIMSTLGILIIFLNYIIPDKLSIFNNLFNNISQLISNILDSITYVYEICLALFIFVSLIFAVILLLGSFSRILKIMNRKTRIIKFK